MITIAKYYDDFFKIYNTDKRPIVLYGAGKGYYACKCILPHVDMICDKKANDIVDIDGIKIATPKGMEEFRVPLYIVVSIMDEKNYYEVCEEIKDYCVTATVFHGYNNIGLIRSYSHSVCDYRVRENRTKLRVNIVCEEQGWILQKFAMRLEENLKKMDVDVDVSEYSKPGYDINHHIQFSSYKPFQNDTIMVSHVDGDKSIGMLKQQLDIAAMAICMSRETMDYLCRMGIRRDKLCYVNPAHDDGVDVKKYTIGITHRCYDSVDVRKRSCALLDIIEPIDPSLFQFIIMGTGWDIIVEKMRKKGIQVDYYSAFDYKKYMSLFSKMDYYLFMGFDEGSMGYLDALNAGVGTIVTPQGFHLDNHCPIDFPCRTIYDFREALIELERKRKRKIDSVRNWTWEMYAKKHLDIWNYIMRNRDLKDLYADQLWYEDGIFSVLPIDNRIDKSY